MQLSPKVIFYSLSRFLAFFILYLFIFLVSPHGMWDLSSLTLEGVSGHVLSHGTPLILSDGADSGVFKGSLMYLLANTGTQSDCSASCSHDVKNAVDQ